MKLMESLGDGTVASNLVPVQRGLANEGSLRRRPFACRLFSHALVVRQRLLRGIAHRLLSRRKQQHPREAIRRSD